jgi:hypothetical protein
MDSDKPIKCHKVIKEAIFGRRVHLFLGWTNEEFDKWSGCTDPGDKVSSDFAAFSCSIRYKRGRPTEWAVVIFDWQWLARDYNSLVHELTHALIQIWALNNMRVNEDTQEFFAHSLGKMTEAAIRVIPR